MAAMRQPPPPRITVRRRGFLAGFGTLYFLAEAGPVWKTLEAPTTLRGSSTLQGASNTFLQVLTSGGLQSNDAKASLRRNGVQSEGNANEGLMGGRCRRAARRQVAATAATTSAPGPVHKLCKPDLRAAAAAGSARVSPQL